MTYIDLRIEVNYLVEINLLHICSNCFQFIATDLTTTIINRIPDKSIPFMIFNSERKRKCVLRLLKGEERETSESILNESVHADIDCRRCSIHRQYDVYRRLN